ncbi:MAG: 2'-deoxycytidine 5'-triphosphate deaminase, partial [Candidatus Rokuibacteriota bacterium]
MNEGVLSDRELRVAARDGWVAAPGGIEERQFQPASLDLRLGPDAYQLRASFLPFRETVQSRLGERGLADSDLVIDQLSLTGS